MAWKTYSAVINFENLKKCSSESLEKGLYSLKNKNLIIKEFIKPNVIVFKSNNPNVGKFIENWLLEKFQPKKIKN